MTFVNRVKACEVGTSFGKLFHVLNKN